MADLNQSDNDEPLTKPKKPRSEAQKAATEKMRSKLVEKQVSSKLSTNEEKKLFLKAVKDKLNNALPPPVEIDDAKTDDESEPEHVPAPVPAKKEKPVKVAKPKPTPQVVEESESESDEEVIVIKKKKKPKKKTIIIEESSDEDDDAPESTHMKQPVRQPRSQQHKNSKIMVQRAQQQQLNYDMYF